MKVFRMGAGLNNQLFFIPDQLLTEHIRVIGHFDHFKLDAENLTGLGKTQGKLFVIIHFRPDLIWDVGI